MPFTVCKPMSNRSRIGTDEGALSPANAPANSHAGQLLATIALLSCRRLGGEGTGSSTHLTRCHWPWVAAQAAGRKKHSCCLRGLHPHQSCCHCCCCLQPRPASGGAWGAGNPWSPCWHWHQHQRRVLLMPPEHPWASEWPSCTSDQCVTWTISKTLCRGSCVKGDI